MPSHDLLMSYDMAEKLYKDTKDIYECNKIADNLTGPKNKQ